MSSPNILWICTDQQRWDTLGCYGNRFVQTPNLDRLAERGTLFEHAYSQSPVCAPSRASFLTGRYPRTARCRQNGQDIPSDEVFVTKLLADHGYVCGLSGKLHTSACQPSVCEKMERRIEDGYSEFHWSHHTGAGYGTHNEYWAWLAERNAKFATPPHPESRWIQKGMPEHLHHTTWCIHKATDFIKDRAEEDRPWLFSVNMFNPHHPFDPPESYLNRYLEFLQEIPLPHYAEGELATKSPYQRIDHEGAYGQRHAFPNASENRFDAMSAKDHRMVRAAYWAMCDLLDAKIGDLLAVLEETRQIENTVMIFTSDHGELLGDHGIYLKGPHFYEPAIRVPLIFSWPGHIRARRSPALVELTDIAQSLLDAVGLPHHAGMQGKSLWPLLNGDVGPEHHRHDVYCEYYNAMPHHRDPAAQLTMVRTRHHKLVVDHSHSAGELYDLVRDPAETKNLWSNATAQALKTEMLLRLCNRMAWTIDPLPERRAEY